MSFTEINCEGSYVACGKLSGEGFDESKQRWKQGRRCRPSNCHPYRTMSTTVSDLPKGDPVFRMKIWERLLPKSWAACQRSERRRRALRGKAIRIASHKMSKETLARAACSGASLINCRVQFMNNHHIEEKWANRLAAEGQTAPLCLVADARTQSAYRTAAIGRRRASRNSDCRRFCKREACNAVRRSPFPPFSSMR